MVGGIGGPGGSGSTGPGKVSGAGAPGAPDAASATEKTKGPKETSFSETLSANEASKTNSASQTGAAEPLDRLRAGEIDRTQYVELKVHEATAHLDGMLPAEDVAKIQDELRDLLENDPDVAALVKRAESG